MIFSILVVEDDSALREAICDTLELVGYQTFEANTGKDALQILEKEKFDIVIGSPARLMNRTMLKAKTHPTGKHEKELAK